jgi:Leucine rich repeat variant
MSPFDDALDPQTSPERLLILAQGADRALACLIYEHPNVDIAVLGRLTTNIPELVVMHPLLATAPQEAFVHWPTSAWFRLRTLGQMPARLAPLARQRDPFATEPEGEESVEQARRELETAADPEWTIARISTHNHHAVRALGIQRASVALLEQLACHDVGAFRQSAAEAGHLPAYMLEALAFDPDPSVRWMVARRTDLEPQLLAQMALDPDPEVRGEVARHPNTPPDVVAELAQDEHPRVRVRHAARRRPGADGDRPPG